MKLLTESQMIDKVYQWYEDETESQKIVFRNSAEKDLVDYHHSLGAQIRNTFGLWNRAWAPELIEGADHSTNHPDSISHRVITEVWKRAQNAR